MYIFIYIIFLILNRSRFCCFTTPIAMSYNDNMLIYVNHTQLKYQIKILKAVKI